MSHLENRKTDLRAFLSFLISGTTVTIVLSAVLVFFTSLPLPADDMVGDRPDMTESPFPVAAGSIQIETGYTYISSEYLNEHNIGDLMIRFGIHERIEFRLGVSSYIVQKADDETINGRDNPFLGLKILLFSPESDGCLLPHLAVIGDVTLPAGSKEYKSDGIEPLGILSAAWDLPADIEFGVNLSYESITEDDKRTGVFGASFVLAYELSDSFGIYAEHYMGKAEKESAVHFADAGLVFYAAENLHLDIWGGRNLNAEKVWFAGCGAVFRIPDVW